MARLIKDFSKTLGLAPGSLVHVGVRHRERTRITVIDYDREDVREFEAESLDEVLACKSTKPVTWVNVDGVHDVDLVEKIGTHFGLHPLVMEDIVNTGQRPKHEVYEDAVFVVLKMLYNDQDTGGIRAEQVSLILCEGCVLSLQEREGDVFDPVRARIRSGKGRLREAGADYLFYGLIDAVVDNYYVILERMGATIETLEDTLISDPEPTTLRAIHGLKKDTAFLRKSLWPLRELVASLQREEGGLVTRETGVYMRDVYDHIVQVLDTVETFRDVVSGMLDLYLSSVSNRMNEVMKVLTIIATIFIPITFIAGVYGMNFNPQVSPWNMPELNAKYGYPAVWAVMLMVIGGMLVYFRKKKWL